VTGTASRPPILRSAHVARPVDEAFAVFTDRIGAWWPLPSHGVFGADAGGLAFEDGLLVERATDGRTSVWGEVVRWEPPHRVVLTWHPGRDADDSSEVEVRFAPVDGGGTRVELEHRGWERFGEDAVARRRTYVGPSAWGHVLDHYADGAEPRPGAADVTALVAAYDMFFAEALRGGFGAPPPGEWDAARVVAHVALSDLAMTAVAQALVHGRTDLEFTNVVCQDPGVLTAFVDETGDLAALVARGREIAATTTAAVQRLGADQLATPVHCRLLHDGEVALDATLSWGSLAVDTQASRHLTAHTGQLRDLRE
jgi:uncharacterized protein YndB with AHSA1/START domain